MNTLGKQIVIGLSILGLSFTSIGHLSAQSEEDDSSVTSYDFEDDLVSGDLVRPDGENLLVRRKGKRTSLIRIREHFVPEMLKSVEDL